MWILDSKTKYTYYIGGLAYLRYMAHLTLLMKAQL